MPEVRDSGATTPGEKQNQPGMFQLTCTCRRVLVVLMGMATCPTCRLVHQASVSSRPMTEAEKRIAGAHLRGERLPVAEPTVTQKEGLR